MHRLHWVNTFLPMIVPWSLGNPFFIFLMIQFVRTIPFELDESALIDGCTKFGIFYRIILPLCKPALVTVAIFSFYWRWQDFIQPVIYLSKPKLYTVSVALRLFADPTSVTNWGAMFAMASVSILPVMIVFFILQKYIVEGISTTGLKG
jgi:multiple sugar transport system permease protein